MAPTLDMYSEQVMKEYKEQGVKEIRLGGRNDKHINVFHDISLTTGREKDF